MVIRTLPLPTILDTGGGGGSQITYDDNKVVASTYGVAVITNSIPAITANLSQRVGINNANPEYQLDVISSSSNYFRISDNTNFLSMRYDNNFLLTTNSKEIRLSNTLLNLDKSQLILDGSPVNISGSKLDYLNTLQEGIAYSSKALILDINKNITGINYLSASYINGQLITSYQPNITEVDTLNIKSHNNTTTGLKLSNILVKASAQQLDYTIATPGSGSSNKALILDTNRAITNIASITSELLYGTIRTESQPYISLLDTVDIAGHDSYSKGLYLGGDLVTASARQINYLNTATLGTVYPEKAIIADISNNVTGINRLTVNSLVVIDPVQYSSEVYQLGINTTIPNKQLEVNSDIGECMRLSYNAPNGNADKFADLSITEQGGLSISASNSIITIPNNSLYFGGVAIPSAEELNRLQISSVGVAEPSKALIVDDLLNIRNINSLTVNDLTVLDTLNFSSAVDVLLVNTTSTSKQAEINSATGNCLRLANDAPNGNATNYCDFSISELGGLTIEASGSSINMKNQININFTDDQNISYPLSMSANKNEIINGIGIGTQYFLPNSSNTLKKYGSFYITGENVQDTQESGGFVWNLMNGGEEMEVMSISSSGSLLLKDGFIESDRRIKHNIINVPRQESLEKICKLDIKEYSKRKTPNRRECGVIAQEFKKIFPELVHVGKKDEFDDFHSVNYIGIIPHLVQCIQSLREQIDEMKKNVNTGNEKKY